MITGYRAEFVYCDREGQIAHQLATSKDFCPTIPFQWESLDHAIGKFSTEADAWTGIRNINQSRELLDGTIDGHKTLYYPAELRYGGGRFGKAYRVVPIEREPDKVEGGIMPIYGMMLDENGEPAGMMPIAIMTFTTNERTVSLDTPLLDDDESASILLDIEKMWEDMLDEIRG